MSPERIIALPDLDLIRTRDPNNHLPCRKSQLLAYVSGRARWSDLLMYRALGSTSAVHRHCHLHDGDRWTFETPYGDHDDLRLLGFEVYSAGTVDLPLFEWGLADLLAAGQPVLFCAPRHHFPHWLEFMRRAGTAPEEYGLPHSYLVCGASDTDLLLVDDATDDHEYRPLTVSRDVLRQGYAREPERWFTDCATVRQVTGPDLDSFEAAYRAFLAGFDDGFELYDVIGDNLAVERASATATHRAPGVNSMALLAGSRVLFCRFLAHTAHGGAVRAAYARVAQLTTVLSDRVTAFQAGLPDLPVDRIRRCLTQLRLREQQAARLLLDEAAVLPRILPTRHQAPVPAWASAPRPRRWRTSSATPAPTRTSY